MKHTKTILALSLTSLFAGAAYAEESFTAALDKSSVDVNMNLRYESVSQDNTKEDADALTLRTRATVTTGTYNNFSAVVGFEDVRQVAGVNDYQDAVGNNGQYSVIADPEVTEVDQAYVQYKTENFTTKLGRQVLTLDNQRFVGHVGWRQDRQTFDALSFAYAVNKDIALQYSFINKRNRLFAEVNDVQSKDHLLNASVNTDLGKFTAYGYVLEVDNNTENDLDTFGLRYTGGQKLETTKLTYQLEYATQYSNDGTNRYSADYLLAELAANWSGITGKLGYEVLGSDHGQYAFSTPLATLHKFNGWADQFIKTPTQGLVDLYVTVGGEAFSGKWSVTYHDFSADENSAADDLGSEIDAIYKKSFNKHFSAGVKFALYEAGDLTTDKVDTDKVWLWTTLTF